MSNTYRGDVAASPNIHDGDHWSAVKRTLSFDKPYNIMTLTLRKEMLLDDDQEVYENLKRLQTENFNRIKIPKFTVERNGNILTYESEFIKGETLRSISDYEIMYEDLVLRDSDYSFNTFRPQNFIKDWRGDIYAIDLDDYKFIPLQDRIGKWERSMRYFGHVVRAYRGRYQLQVKIYGEGQRQTKLKQLIDGMFNAVIEECTFPPEFYGDFAISIDGKLYDKFEDVMDHLKNLYMEFRSQMDMDSNGLFQYHDWKADRSSVLFDSNNRTTTIG